MPFCGEVISYKIDERLNFLVLDRLAKDQLTNFNSTGMAKHNPDCYFYRKVLSCSLAFPICSQSPYVSFPCKDVCLKHYTTCGASSEEDLAVCNSFPTGDCVPLTLLVAKPSSLASSMYPSTLLIAIIMAFL